MWFLWTTETLGNVEIFNSVFFAVLLNVSPPGKAKNLIFEKKDDTTPFLICQPISQNGLRDINYPVFSWTSSIMSFSLFISFFLTVASLIERALAWFDKCLKYSNIRGHNRPFAQLLSGLGTGHPASAGPSPAFNFNVSDEEKAVLLDSVLDCSECDSSGLDHLNSKLNLEHCSS